MTIVFSILVKILYPKAFNARREAMKLMREVELAEQQRSVACFDSMLLVKRAELEETIKSGFIFEKDEKYQEIGNFMIASQAPMKNLTNSYLRGQVDENGVLTITSIYRGRPIAHNKIKVSGILKTPRLLPYYKRRLQTQLNLYERKKRFQ